MAPIPRNENEWPAEKRSIDDGLEPTTPRPRRMSPMRLIVSTLVFLVTLGLLQGPIGHCAHRVNKHLCRPRTIEQRVRKVLSTTPLIDGHIDMPMRIRGEYENRIDNDEFREVFENGLAKGDTDIKRLRQGMSGGAFWSVWAPCPKNGSDFSKENGKDSVQFTLDQIDVMTRIQAMYPSDFSQIQGITADGAVAAWKEGKFISPLGVEGLHQIGNMASNLRRFYDLGVRYATLTHNCHNMYADACQEEHPLRKAKPIYHGVSKDGRKIVQEMNRIGMIVDIAHVSEDTMVDVLGGSDDWEGSQAPVMYSHSSAFAICPHPRNVKDHVLDLVKARNSVVMINVAGQFISCRDIGADDGIPVPVPEEATLGRVADHIMYIGDKIGYDHVGIGTDLDGIPDPPTGFTDVTDYPALIAELLRRGVTDEDAGKVVGGNVLRVWRDVEKVSAKLKAAGTPVLEDDVSYNGPY